MMNNNSSQIKQKRLQVIILEEEKETQIQLLSQGKAPQPDFSRNSKVIKKD